MGPGFRRDDGRVALTYARAPIREDATAMTQGTHDFADDPRNREILIYVKDRKSTRLNSSH